MFVCVMHIIVHSLGAIAGLTHAQYACVYFELTIYLIMLEIIGIN